MTEEYSFNPEITNYDLPDRQKNSFIENVSRAEEARRDKLESLKSTLLHEETEQCTFAPSIQRSAKFKSNRVASNKPVFVRLTEKGLQYNEAKEKRKEVPSSQINMLLHRAHFIYAMYFAVSIFPKKIPTGRNCFLQKLIKRPVYITRIASNCLRH